MLASGILDLTKKEESRHTQTIQAINSNGDTLEKKHQEIASLISSNQETQSKEFNKAITAITDTQEKQTQILSSIEKENGANAQTILDTLKTTNETAQKTESNLIAQINASTQSLEKLVKLSDQNRSQALSELASSVEDIVNQSSNDSKKLSTELTALAKHVSSMKNDLSTSQTAIEELNHLVPGWRKTGEQQFAALQESANRLNEKTQQNMNLIETKIANLNKALDESAETLMKALYVSTQGLEETKVELKSEMAVQCLRNPSKLGSLDAIYERNQFVFGRVARRHRPFSLLHNHIGAGKRKS